MASAAERLAAFIEDAEGLDNPAYAVANGLSTTLELTGTASQPIQNALHGTWMGHPLHPALATVPVGTWTMALGLDACDALGIAPDGAGKAADLALTIGTAGALAAAAAGAADWRQVHGKDRRTGLAHAALNSTALGLTIGSLVMRRRGRRGAGRALSAAGWLTLAAGAYLGGHLVYRGRSGRPFARAAQLPARDRLGRPGGRPPTPRRGLGRGGACHDRYRAGAPSRASPCHGVTMLSHGRPAGRRLGAEWRACLSMARVAVLPCHGSGPGWPLHLAPTRLRCPGQGGAGRGQAQA